MSWLMNGFWTNTPAIDSFITLTDELEQPQRIAWVLGTLGIKRGITQAPPLKQFVHRLILAVDDDCEVLNTVKKITYFAFQITFFAIFNHLKNHFFTSKIHFLIRALVIIHQIYSVSFFFLPGPINRSENLSHFVREPSPSLCVELEPGIIPSKLTLPFPHLSYVYFRPLSRVASPSKNTREVIRRQTADVEHDGRVSLIILQRAFRGRKKIYTYSILLEV